VNIEKLIKSSWYRKAEEPESAERVRTTFGEKLKKVARKANVVAAAERLHAYFSDPDVPAAKKTLIIAGLLYFIAPIDAVLDFIPAVGLIDDVAVMTAVLTYLAKDLSQHAAARKAALQNQATLEPGAESSGKQPVVGLAAVDASQPPPGKTQDAAEGRAPELSPRFGNRKPVESEKDKRKTEPAGQGPRKPLRARLLGWLINPYVDELESRMDARLEREMSMRLRIIIYALVASIAAAGIGIVYYLVRRGMGAGP